MNWKILKQKWTIANYICNFFIIAWCILSCWGIIFYGFHWKPITKIELLVDKITLIGIGIGVYIRFLVVFEVVSYIIADKASKLDNIK